MQRSLISSAAITAFLLATAQALAATSPDAFIKDAVQGDNSEIMLGLLAQQKGASDKVRDFGKMLATDHATAKDEAMAVAKQIGVTPSDQPSADAEAEKTKLSGLSGSAFDNEFAAFMVKGHEENIKKFQEQADAKQGPTSDLAAKQLPVLEKHLQMAKAGESNDATSASMGSAPTEEPKDQWRASKLAGVPIYGPDNKEVGKITDVLMSKDGKAQAIVIGVGGFLGLGEKNVSVPYDKVKFTDQPVTLPAATPTPIATPAGTARQCGRGDGKRPCGDARRPSDASEGERSLSRPWRNRHDRGSVERGPELPLRELTRKAPRWRRRPERSGGVPRRPYLLHPRGLETDDPRGALPRGVVAGPSPPLSSTPSSVLALLDKRRSDVRRSRPTDTRVPNSSG